MLCRIFSDGTPVAVRYSGFEASHGLATVVAQGALLVELGPVALPYETAVAHQKRRLVSQSFGQRRHGGAVVRAGGDDFGQRRRRRQQGLGLGAQRVGQRLARFQTVAQGGKIARAAAADGQALQGAFDIGRTPQRLAYPFAHGRPLDEELHQVEPALDLAALCKRCCDAFGQQAGAGTGQSAVDGGQQAAVAPPIEAFHQLEITPRRRVDLHRAVGALAARRHQRRALAGLGQFHIVEQRPAGRDFGARKGTEALKCSDVEGLEQPLAGIVAVEPRRRQRRQNGVPFLQHCLERFARQQAVRNQQFARRQPRQGSGELARQQRLGREIGRRESSHARARSPCASATATR